MKQPWRIAPMAIAAAATLVVGYPWAGEAQPSRAPPVPEDAGEALHSNLWERVLHPNRPRYEQRVRRAQRLLGRRDDQAHEEALAALRSAIELAPAEPEAHWLMGLVLERRARWQACADAYGEVFALAPDYQPAIAPPERKAPWAVDFGLALCHAQAGAYEHALVHYKRILSRGFTGEALVHRHLGQTYMALGRLAEAIDALQTALRHQPRQVRTHYALAVAHDRNEQPAEASRHLAAARRLDRGLGHLNDPREEIIPAADVLYYWALAHESAGNRAWAIAYFRHYLHTTGPGPWTHRARHHVAMLGTDMATASAVEIDGTGALERGAVTEAVRRADAALQACVRPVPRVLFDVRITAVVGPRKRRGGPARGVKARALYSFATEKDALAEAQRCLEGVAERIDLPQPAGRGSRYTTVRFPVIALPAASGADREAPP